MNVKLASTGTPEVSGKPSNPSVKTLAAEDRRIKLIITSQSGDLYVNFSTTEPSATVFDIKLSAGTSFTIDNYTGPCTANTTNVRYISFH